jgi:hypothetical protein
MSNFAGLPSDVWQEAYNAAINEGFPEVIRILLKVHDGAAEMAPQERAHLMEFARFLQLKAELHFPYWDDSATPHSPEHEDAFHAVNMGLYEKLASALEMGREE